MKKRNRKEYAYDKRIEQLYYKTCSGVQVNILDIGKIFDAGRKAIDANPMIGDDALSRVIVDFVQTIRKN